STHVLEEDLGHSNRLGLACVPAYFQSHFFFFNDTAPTEIYTLSLHDALPIFLAKGFARQIAPPSFLPEARCASPAAPRSRQENSGHSQRSTSLRGSAQSRIPQSLAPRRALR